VRLYNAAPFVAAALNGAFAQTYSPLEIIVADDHSEDESFAIAERLAAAYRGPHRVALLRNEANLGVGSQIEVIRAAMHGEILVIADGDDISLPERVARVAEAFTRGGPGLMGVDCRFSIIDERGRPITDVPLAVAGVGGPSERLTAAEIARGRGGPHGAAAAYRRTVLDAGSPLAGLRHSEDRILALRGRLLGRLLTLPEDLVLRRVHGANVSGAVGTSWSGEKLRAWLDEETRRRVAVTAAMRRNLAAMAAAGLIDGAEVAETAAAIASYGREVRVIRAARRLGWTALLPLHRELRRLGVPPRESLRAILTQTCPVLAMMLLRRNPLVRARERGRLR